MAQIYVRLTHGEPQLHAQLIAGAA
jgi:hypothetical protein